MARIQDAFNESHFVTDPLTADGSFKDRSAANVTGKGWITGVHFTGDPAGSKLVIHDETSTGGKVLFDHEVQLEGEDTYFFPQNSWIRYTRGFYGNVTATTARAVVYYRPEASS